MLEPGDILDQRGEPVALQAGRAVHQQRRADLDDDAAVGAEGVAGHACPSANVCAQKPPSVLPDMSASRGEMGSFNDFALPTTTAVGETQAAVQSPPLRGRCPAGQRGVAWSADIINLSLSPGRAAPSPSQSP